MKLLLVVSILLSANLGYSKVFNDKDKNEAYANIMGLYVEELEKEVSNTSLTEQEKFNLKRSMKIAKKEIDETEVRKSRMFLTLNFDFMCESLDLRGSTNDKKIAVMRNRLKRGMDKSKTKHRKRVILRVLMLKGTISDVQNKFCSN